MELLEAQSGKEKASRETEEGSSLVPYHYEAHGSIQLWKGDQGAYGSQKFGPLHLQRLYGQSSRVRKREASLKEAI